MADNQSVLGQEDIVPESTNAPQLDKTGTPTSLQDIAKTISSSDFAKSAIFPNNISARVFDKRLGEYSALEGVDVYEQVAQSQSGLEQMGMFIPRAATKAATEALKLPGFAAGAIEWASTGFDPAEYGNAFNNGWNVALDNFNTNLQEQGLPVYTPESVRDGNIFDKLASTSFWASEGADGVGFLVGMMAPGAILRWANVGEKIAGASKVFTAAERLAMPAEELSAVAKSANTAARINDWSSAVINTVYESATEGVQTFNDYLKDNPDDIEGAGNAAKNTFLVNNAILIGPNMLNQKWLFNGFKRAAGVEASEAVGKSGIAKQIEKTITKDGISELKAPTLFDKTLNVGKVLGKGVLSEGFFEEGLQYAASEGAKKGVNVLNPIELLKEYAEDITADTKGNTEMWSGIILGSVLGGGMAGYGGIKQAAREEKVASEYNKLLSSNYINYFKTYKDYAKTENGKPVLNKEGNYELDATKVIEGGEQAIKNAYLREMGNKAFKEGNQEAYDNISNILHFDYMLPWLQIEGGTELLKKHISTLASKEHQKDVEALGIETKTVKELEKQLLSKVDTFQKIYNDVVDTHDINFKVKLPEGATQDDLAKFSNVVKNAKLSSKITMDYKLGRIESLKSDLSNLGITATSERLDQSMVDELKSKFAELKKTKTIDKVQELDINKKIDIIEKSVKSYTTAAQALNDAFDNKKNQTAFEDMLKAQKEANKTISDSKTEAGGKETKAEKSKFINDPELKAFWEQNVKVEDYGSTQKPIVTEGEETPNVIPGKASLITTRGLVKISYTDAAGKKHKVIAALGDGNAAGNLNLRILKKDEDGKLVPDKSRAGIAFLNSMTEFKLAANPVSFKATVEIYKSADDIKLEQQMDAAIQVYREYIDNYNDGIKRFGNEISEKKARIKELVQKLNDALKSHKNGLLTERGLERKFYTGTREEAGNIIRVYKTASEINAEIADIKKSISTLEGRRESYKERRAEFKEKLKSLKTSESLPLEDLQSLIEFSEKEQGFSDNMISLAKEAVDEAEKIVRNTLIRMRVYRSKIAKLINMDISDNALGIFGMPTDEKNAFIDNLLLNKIDEIQEGDYVFEEKELELINKFEIAKEELANTELLLAENKETLTKYNSLTDKFRTEAASAKFQFSKVFTAYKKLIPNYFSELDIYEKDLVDAESGIDMEGDFKDTFDITIPYEKDAHHVYTGFESFLTIGSNQDYAAANKDVSRWFVFVNNYAYKSQANQNKRQYALRTYTYEQVASESEYVKDNLKFFVGDNKTMSYNEIQKSKDKSKLEAKATDDIKVVIVNFTDNNQLEYFDAEGNPDDKGKHIIFSSLNAGEGSTVEFSKRQFINNFIDEKVKAGLEKSDALREEAESEYEKSFEENKAKFIEFRKSLNNQSVTLDISGINVGKKITEVGGKDILTEMDVLDGIINPLYSAYFIISSPSKNEDGEYAEHVETINGNDHVLRRGFTYVLNQGKPEVIKPRTLKETNSVEEIFRLFQYAARGEKDSNTALNYLKQVLNMKSDDPDFRLFFVNDTSKQGKKVEGKYSTLVFGGNEISTKDLVDGKDVGVFKTFLETKYWNISRKEIKETNKEFSEYTVDKSGKLKEIPWSTKDGGYRGFLFSRKDNNKSKGTIKVRPLPKGEKNRKQLLAENPQYANQSIRTEIRGSEPVVKEKPVSDSKTLSGETFMLTVNLTTESGGTTVRKVIYDQQNKRLLIVHPDIPEKNRFNDTEKAIVSKALKGMLNDITKSLNGFKRAKVKFDMYDVVIEMDHKLVSEEKEIDKDVKLEDLFETGEIKREAVSDTPKKGLTEKAEITLGDTSKITLEGVWSKATEKQQATALNKAIEITFNKSTDKTATTLEGFKKEVIADKNKYNKEIVPLAKKLRYDSVIDAVNSASNNVYRVVRDRDTNYQFEKKSTINWFRQKFPNIPIEVVNGLIEGRAWGKLMTSGKVLISNLAEEGTTYHEAFHTWNILFNSEDGQNALYTEVKKRLGVQEHEMSDAEAEEFLAEEFRDYMMLGANYKFNKGQEKQKSFFKKIWNTIKEIFSKIFGIDVTTTDANEIELAFGKINSGTFIDKVNKSQVPLYRIADTISPVEELAYVQDMNFHFFRMLVNDVNSDGDLIFKLDESADDLYDKLLDHYTDLKIAADLQDKTFPFEDILTYWDQFEEKHKLFLTQYKIDLRDDRDEDDVISQAYVESYSRPMGDSVPSAIRLLIGSLPNVNSELKPILDDQYLTFRNVEYNRVINLLFNQLTQVTNPVAMMDKLKSLSSKHPELGLLWKYLGGKTDSNLFTPTKIKLLTQFYSTFATNKNAVTISNFKNDGNVTYIDAVDETAKEVTKRQWIENAQKKALEGTSNYLNYKDGDYVINRDRLIEGIKNASTEVVLKGLGMSMGHSTFSINNDKRAKNYLKRLDQILKLYRDHRPKEVIKLNDLYDRDRIENQVELDALASFAAEAILNDSDLMYFNQNGDMEWSIARNSHLSETVNRLNDYAVTGELTDSLKKLKPYDGKEGTLYSLHSLYWDFIEQGGQIKFGLYKGLTSQNGDGSELSEANYTDFKSGEFDSVLRNVIPFRRAADRAPEYTFEAFGTNYNLGEESLLGKMMDYLYDEVITSIALITDKSKDKKFGGNLANYSKNGRNLRTFGFLFDKNYNKGKYIETIEEYLDNSDIKKVDFNKLKSLTQEYIDSNKDAIRDVMRVFISESMKANKESLLESRIVKEEDGKYLISGLNKETIHGEKYFNIKGDTYGRVSNQDLNKILLVHFHNNFIGMQEQMKMFTGDLAGYKSMADSGKRTTSSASTKIETANDQKTLDVLDTLYPKVNGSPREKVVHEVIISSIKEDASEELVKFDSHYKGMDIADGQMWGTLDFIRDVGLRTGTWSDKQEYAFQYEMQNLVLRVLESDELNKLWPTASKEMFISGVFAKHTGGRFVKRPMFNQEEIDIYDISKMGRLPAIKPLGTGFVEGLNISAQAINKMSVSTILPSMLDDNSLKFLLSMMQNNVDKVGDPTTMKSDYYLNNINIENGELIDSTSRITNISFDDYGIQNEIQTEEKGRVTDSTQKIATVYNNVYDNGTIRPEFADLEEDIKERNDLLNEVNSRNMQKVIDELSLTYDENKGVYHLTKENEPKFKKLLTTLFVQRLLPDNIIDGLGYVLDSEEKVLDLFTDSNKVEQVLMAFVKNNVIKRKVNGEMLVQESAYMYDSTLKFYERGENETSRAEVMIPVPEEWNDWVRSIGGLENLNKMLSEGKLDKRLTEFVANRIPTADLNTIEAFTVKKFLPTHAGARIILPYAIVAKTSSDYDIDKLTCYFNNAKRDKNGKIMFTKTGPVYLEYNKDGGNSIQAIENRLNELHAKAILHKNRYDLLVTPHASDRIKALANDKRFYTASSYLDKLEEREKDKYYTATQWWFNARKAKSFWGGIQGLSIAAASNTVNSQLQQFPVAIADDIVNTGLLFFEGQQLKPGEKYISGHLKDSDGNLTSDNYGQIMVTCVDVAKDDFGSKLNMSPDTLGVWSMLNSFGKKAGIGLEQISALMTHPIVVEYMNRMDISNSVSAKHNQYIGNKFDPKWFNENIGYQSDIINELIIKYGPKDKNGKLAPTCGYPNNADKLLWSTMKNYLRNPNDVKDVLDNRKNNTSKYRYLSVNEIVKNKTGVTAIQVLDNFLMYKLFASQTARLNGAIRPYAANSFGKSLNAIDIKVNKVDRLLSFENSNPFFNREDVDNHINNNFLKSSNAAYGKTLELYAWTTLTKKYPELDKLFKSMFVDSYIFAKEKDSEKVLQTAKNQFLSFVFSFYNRNSKEARERYTELFTGDGSLPNQLIKIKDKLSNEALNILRPVINEYSVELGRNRENNYIASFNKKYGVSEQNMYVAVLEELFSSKDESVIKFANDFFDFSMYQNGIGNSAITYMSMMPNSTFVKALDKVVGYYMNIVKDNPKANRDVFQSFKDQFMRNNYHNSKIVYRDNTPITDSDFYEKASNGEFVISSKIKTKTVNSKSNAARNEYLTVRYYKTPSKERALNKRQKLKNPVEYLLYKRDDVQSSKDKITFSLIEKLGDGSRFKEYYPVTNGTVVKSILNANKYEGVIEVKEDKKEKELDRPKDKKSDLKSIFDQLEEQGIDYTQPNEDLDNSMKNFLDSIGVTYKAVDNLTSIAAANLSEMTVEVMEGKRNLKTLPEEAAHFYVYLLGEDSGLYKSMYNSIVNYPIYAKTVELYKERYNNNEKKLREEAIGKLIADKIIAGADSSLTTRQQEQVNNWWSKLWSMIKELFTKTKSDPYVKSAYDILTKNTSELRTAPIERGDQLLNKQEVIESIISKYNESDKELMRKELTSKDKEEFNRMVSRAGYNNLGKYYTPSSLNTFYELSDLESEWNNLPFTAKGVYKYDYQRTIESAENAYSRYIDTFGLENVTYIPVVDNNFKAKIAIKKPLPKKNNVDGIISREDSAIENMKELVKAPVTFSAEQLVINFDTYFPDQSYLEESEKIAQMKMIENGDLTISCSF